MTTIPETQSTGGCGDIASAMDRQTETVNPPAANSTIAVLTCCGFAMRWIHGGFRCTMCQSIVRVKRDDYSICNYCNFWVHNTLVALVQQGDEQQTWCNVCRSKDWDVYSDGDEEEEEEEEKEEEKHKMHEPCRLGL